VIIKLTIRIEENLSNNEIKERIQKAIDSENLAFVTKKLLNNADLEKISPGVGRILWNHLRTVMIMKEAQNEYDKRLQNHLDEYEQSLKKSYKIRSNIKEWMKEQLENEKVFSLRLSNLRVYLTFAIILENLRKNLKRTIYTRFMNRF